MAEVPFRPARLLSEDKGKGASASRERHLPPDTEENRTQYLDIFPFRNLKSCDYFLCYSFFRVLSTAFLVIGFRRQLIPEDS